MLLQFYVSGALGLTSLPLHAFIPLHESYYTLLNSGQAIYLALTTITSSCTRQDDGVRTPDGVINLPDERSGVITEFDVSESTGLGYVAQITAADRKQKATKTKRLAKNALPDPVRCVGDHVQNEGCDGDAMKRLLFILLQQKKYNKKC